MVDISSGQQKLLRERNPENAVSSGYWTQRNSNKISDRSVDKSSVTFHKSAVSSSGRNSLVRKLVVTLFLSEKHQKCQQPNVWKLVFTY